MYIPKTINKLILLKGKKKNHMGWWNEVSKIIMLPVGISLGLLYIKKRNWATHRTLR